MKAWQHFKTITRHRWLVRQGCFKVGLYWQGLTHDLSKYSPTEFIPSVRYYQGNRSPNDMQRYKFGYSSSWMHHKGRNRHHFEFWTDYDPKGTGMPKKYVAEMFCDRLAASKVYRGDQFRQGDPYLFFLKGKGRQLLIHPNTYELLEFILIKLRDEGEDATFDYIRRELLGK